jgi:hypothetical protein
MDSMMIPFIMLLIVTIALVLERRFHEEKIVNIYEDKFDQWKQHATLDETQEKPKELVGLLFLENEKLNIELLDNKVLDRLERKKYSIKQKG